jgi:hypothetical protein
MPFMLLDFIIGLTGDKYKSWCLLFRNLPRFLSLPTTQAQIFSSSLYCRKPSTHILPQIWEKKFHTRSRQLNITIVTLYSLYSQAMLYCNGTFLSNFHFQNAEVRVSTYHRTCKSKIRLLVLILTAKHSRYTRQQNLKIYELNHDAWIACIP